MFVYLKFSGMKVAAKTVINMILLAFKKSF